MLHLQTKILASLCGCRRSSPTTANFLRLQFLLILLSKFDFGGKQRGDTTCSSQVFDSLYGGGWMTFGRIFVSRSAMEQRKSWMRSPFLSVLAVNSIQIDVYLGARAALFITRAVRVVIKIIRLNAVASEATE